jgi:hypothetical protein
MLSHDRTNSLTKSISQTNFFSMSSNTKASTEHNTENVYVKHSCNNGFNTLSLTFSYLFPSVLSLAKIYYVLRVLETKPSFILSISVRNMQSRIKAQTNFQLLHPL